MNKWTKYINANLFTYSRNTCLRHNRDKKSHDLGPASSFGLTVQPVICHPPIRSRRQRRRRQPQKSSEKCCVTPDRRLWLGLCPAAYPGILKPPTQPALIDNGMWGITHAGTGDWKCSDASPIINAAEAAEGLLGHTAYQANDDPENLQLWRAEYAR